MADQQTEDNVRATAEQLNTQEAGPQTDESGVAELQRQLTEAEQRAEASENKYLRARADMDNYKKRIERTYADLAKSSKKDLLVRLLSVKDNLERALRYSEGNGGQSEVILEGVRLTEYQLNQLLQQEGVKPIDAEGKAFDPSDEEAIQTVHDPNLPDHTVVQVVRQGYLYDGEVLRPAQVIVNVLDDSQ